MAQSLLETKANDYQVNASLMPVKARILSKLFAKELGRTAGKILSVYNNMFAGLEEEEFVEIVKAVVRRDVNSKSKVTIKPPFMDPRNVRVCGLVALNYAGFFDAEVDLYDSLRRNNVRSVEDVLRTSQQEPSHYGSLLQEKQQAIYDFSVLMGLVNDDPRLGELQSNMPVKTADYFDMVVKMHKGGIFGLSWPLPIRKFSEPIREGLTKDTVSRAMQEGVGQDYGFSLPQEAVYKQILDNVKDTMTDVRSPGGFVQKWRIASALPATVFYLSGFNAYAYETVEKVPKIDSPNILGAATTAGISASSLADEDFNSFVTTFLPLFTTSL
jgi:hypothetical protein